MLRSLIVLLLGAALALGANVKLYLKDGSFHIVREYKVEEDRIRFYSVERSEWEEIPVDLVDLKRTESEVKARAEEARANAVIIDEENRAEREAARELSRVPYQPGAYWINGKELTALKQAESKVNNNKTRSILKVLAPAPIVSGKANVELEGATSAFVVNTDRPEFYFRLAAEERFGLFKLKPEKGIRIVQKWTINPVTKEIMEEQDQVEVFRQQAYEGLYKIWPEKPLEPGEYALVEYTEGKANIQIWDFTYKPAPKN
jgi:hypothetical protein